MGKKKIIAMILAGGQGKRLGGLTHFYSKPVIHFGGNCRIIDFTLNNCIDSGIDTIGILSQYFTTDLHEYIAASHGCGRDDDVIHMLPSKSSESAYTGNADAVYRNIAFIDRYMPDNVLVLSDDHIYHMDYEKIIAFHEKKGADVTLASTFVSTREASRFGILKLAENERVQTFEEKPFRPKSNLASMGVYVFKWNKLRKYLLADNASILSRHDFATDIIPAMLSAGGQVYTYRFEGYWRDVGTVDSLWEANMDQINNPDACGITNDGWRLHDECSCDTPIMISDKAVIHNSIVGGGCSIFGSIDHSALSDSVTIGIDSEIVDSVVMPGAYIGNNVKIYNTVIGTNAHIMDNTVIGAENGTDFFVDYHVCPSGISLVAPWLYIKPGMCFQKGSHIHKERLSRYEAFTSPSAFYMNQSAFRVKEG